VRIKALIRNEEGDFNITERHNLVAALYKRKQVNYSENTIYPYVELSDLRSDIIARVKKQAQLQRDDHPWASIIFKPVKWAHSPHNQEKQ
jgi:ATP-dependent DNA helicase RecG